VKSHCHYNNCHHDETKKDWNKNKKRLIKDKEGNQDRNNGSTVVVFIICSMYAKFLWGFYGLPLEH